MKKILFVLLATGFAGILISFRPQAPSSEGKIGDVKYSVLKPQQFVSLHGNGWVLMDGRNINNSALYKLTRKANIPDARGLFIRAMNEGRNGQEGDPDGNREVGKLQGDENKSHSHQYSDAHYAEIHCGNQGLFGNKGEHDNDNGRCTTNQTTAAAGGNESRPRNIALYVYIRIN